MKCTISKEDQQDITELRHNIDLFRHGQIDEERFKLYRLTRGVYGQRQLGVQMFRIKIPYGRITFDQLLCIAEVSDKYATGNLHLTTRQDIQLHYVKLDDAPAVWSALATHGINAREACGNTVRNVTASPEAGIDPEEPFDVSPYARAVASYFLRNPICQEMGRKIKISFSSSGQDTAYSFMHDFGMIARVKDGQRGFTVRVGGGLGAQAMVAQTAHDFLPAEQLIPFLDAALRVFDRYGEREKRHKARLKFLIKKMGLDGYMALVAQEQKAIPYPIYPISEEDHVIAPRPPYPISTTTLPESWQSDYELWLQTNTFAQKQAGYFGIYIQVTLGDISSTQMRSLIDAMRPYAIDDVRLTINQNILFKNIHENHLVAVYQVLREQGFDKIGYDSIADITACPGTDTCNLGVTNSTGLARTLEDMLREEYPELLADHHIKIKISGCMNACGQHMIAHMGFHGSSIKKAGKVIPAMQVVLGGGVDPGGNSRIADKVIKVPTKRVPDLIRRLLDLFTETSQNGQYFNDWYLSLGGKRYFYELLKDLSAADEIPDQLLMDWGQDHLYRQQIGVGECAGVVLDVIGTILKDAIDKLEKSQTELQEAQWSAAIYYAYTAQVIAAKGILLLNDHKCNAQSKIISDFQQYIVGAGLLDYQGDFEIDVLRINQHEPTEDFATSYVHQAKQVLRITLEHYQSSQEDKEVVTHYYNA